MHFFFDPELNANSDHLPENEVHHAFRVLRIKKGERIGLINGKGFRAEAEIWSAQNTEINYRIIRSSQEPHDHPRITVAVGLLKIADRFEWMAEKLTEIGIEKIIPLLTDRVERKRMNLERLNKKILSAAKQAGTSRIPELSPPVSIRDWIEKVKNKTYVAYCGEASHRKEFHEVLDNQKDVTLVIGPEGGISDEEIKLLEYKGCTVISLGKSRLRTETAALIGCHTLHLTYAIKNYGI
jgi:16S rRNA (uracil1498-N3)-methyltransferase